MKTDLFQSCGHCWVFQIFWHIECSTFTASSFRMWNSSTGIPSHPLALFIVNPLILSSTGHTGGIGDTQLQSGDPRRSTCLDLPRDLVLKRLTCLNLLGNLPVQWSQEVDMSWSAQDPILRRLSGLNLYGYSISRRLPCLSLLGDLNPDLGMPGSQVEQYWVG